MVRRHAPLLGLFLLGAASLLLEITLTKFFASKLEHDLTIEIIGAAMLGLAAGGVWVHQRPWLFPRADGLDPDVLGRHAYGFALAALLTIPVFCVTPIDTRFLDFRGTLAIPLFCAMFALPFFFLGVCVSYTLVSERRGPGTIYFWNLLGAGFGAGVAAWAISALSGYGATVAVGLLSLGAALLYWHGTGARPWSFSLTWRVPLVLAAAVVTLAYPPLGRRLYHHDIFSTRHGLLSSASPTGLGGIEMSFWGPIARVDVSKTGDSREREFRRGIARRFDATPLPGRLILIDGDPSTRQVALTGPPAEQDFLKHSLWAAPYVARSPGSSVGRTLVVGAGGGIEILVAKAFRAQHVDAIEPNPDMYRLLLGRPEDPVRDWYVPWVATDADTTVNLMRTEARRWCQARRDQVMYDVIDVSAVDKPTPMSAAANALSESLLYTEDALADYYALLKPGGILSLSQDYVSPGTLTLRTFVTALDLLDKQGVASPGMSIAFIFDGDWQNGLLKKGAFSREEIDRLQAWASLNGYRFIYHPFQAPDTRFFDPGSTVTQTDLPFAALAKARNAAERVAVLSTLRWDLHPSTDERPDFDFVKPSRALDVSSALSPRTILWLIAAAVVAWLVLAPAFLGERQPGEARPSGGRAVPFFALSGFGLMIAENAAFLHLTPVVGGPFYSLAVVLPAMLVGAAFGGLLTDRYLARAKHGLLLIVGLLVAGAAVYFALLRWGLPHLSGTSWSVRLVVSALVTLPLGALLGIPAPWYMHGVDATNRRSLAWMWAVSSAFGVLGAMSFVPVCSALGRTSTMALALLLALAALGWAALARMRRAEPAAPGRFEALSRRLGHAWNRVSGTVRAPLERVKTGVQEAWYRTEWIVRARIEALSPRFARTWKRIALVLGVLVDPLSYVSLRAGLVIAIVINAAVFFLSKYHVLFDGLLHLHLDGAMIPAYLRLLYLFVVWPLPALVFWVGARIATGRGSILEFLMAVGIARGAMLFTASMILGILRSQGGGESLSLMITTLPVTHPNLLSGLLPIALAGIAWLILLLYQGMRRITQAPGLQIFGPFVVCLSVAEALGRALLLIVLS